VRYAASRNFPDAHWSDAKQATVQTGLREKAPQVSIAHIKTNCLFIENKSHPVPLCGFYCS
jgi:transcription initiation factor TFIID subunit TAF12